MQSWHCHCHCSPHHEPSTRVEERAEVDAHPVPGPTGLHLGEPGPPQAYPTCPCAGIPCPCSCPHVLWRARHRHGGRRWGGDGGPGGTRTESERGAAAGGRLRAARGCAGGHRGARGGAGELGLRGGVTPLARSCQHSLVHHSLHPKHCAQGRTDSMSQRRNDVTMS